MKKVAMLVPIIAVVLLAACAPAASPDLDAQLQAVIADHQLAPLSPGPEPDPAQVALGQALFFDNVLSGNRDIACATCHHPVENSGDGLAVSIGTGGSGLGDTRQIGYGREFIPRNAPELFNRGAPEWTTMFWDSRITLLDGHLITPAERQLPDGLDSPLAAQALFPVTSADEMRGVAGDVDVHGNLNELADFSDEELEEIWAALMARLLHYPEYAQLFRAAYPDVPPDEMGIVHVANAIAAFEIEAYTLLHSPWQNYLRGDVDALSAQAKEGALLFYGDAGCAACHSGSLMTNQQHYNLAVPQVGPGKGAEAPLDLGRFRITKETGDLYAFRVPSLHNVAVSGPWMHNGAFSSLETAVRHHLDPATSLRTYDPAAHLPPELQETFQDDPALLGDMVARMETAVAPPRRLTATEVAALLAFLQALTDPNVANLEIYVPSSVPSGLPVIGAPPQDAN